VDKVIRHNTEEATRIEELRPDAPKNIADIVRKLMAKNPADRYQTPDELMDALAPHAAPSVMDWPISAPSAASDRSSQEHVALADVQVDTEPRALSVTKVSDDDSILEWADQSRRSRRLRRVIIAIALLFFGMLALGTAAILAWFLLQ
jgi:serine/threonine protein kinase